jgi:capsular polysaccharide export protein
MADVRITARGLSPLVADARAPRAPVVARVANDTAPRLPLPPVADLKNRRILIVSAPFGPFSRVLAGELEAGGAWVRRMLFNIGDVVYWRRDGGLTFDGDVGDWPAHLADLVVTHGLTDLILFGEGGPYNQAVLSRAEALKALAAEAVARAQAASDRVASVSALEPSRAQAASDRVASVSALEPSRAQAASDRVASVSALRIWVLENGYFRPDWVTVEQDGVNARSSLARHRAAYDPPIPEIVPARPVGRALPHHVANISLYHFLQFLVRPFVFRRYAQPYTAPAWLQCAGHIRRYFGLMLARRSENEVRVIRARGPFFLACLQREGDAQLLRYSTYADNTAFLAEVMTSFARHAPAEARLVVKNHPLDPGLVDLRRITRVLAMDRGLTGRVDFIDGGNLAQLCRASNGMVVNNSSAALSALGFKTPVKVMGQAFFDIEGLTHQDPLDTFWTRQTPPDTDLFTRFRAHVIARTQVNGNYHEPRALKPTAKAIAKRIETTT